MKENFAAKNEIYKPKIKIIGVGGCGTNAVNEITARGIGNVDLFVIDSDKNSLESSLLDTKYKIQIGEKLTNGLGTGGNPNIGESAAEESIEEIRKIVNGTDILLIINGVAGGSAGAVPVITKLAKEQGAVNIVFAVTPVHFEGKRKNENGEKALQKFMEKENCIDSIINASNERFTELADRQSTLNDVFNMVNKKTAECIENFADIFTDEKGLVQISFKDFKEFITNAGFTGIGTSQMCPFDKQQDATEEVMNHPLIKGSFESAEKVIISIKGGSDLTLNFVHEITKEITDKIDENAEVMLSVQITLLGKFLNQFVITVITA
ncbi:MAG: cell division FtsZ family protein [Candidatus Gastranaerophilales bacterium]|nr:cell division FtsZ family protein [Candidatus Gastranaerophilales bacterium]